MLKTRRPITRFDDRADEPELGATATLKRDPESTKVASGTTHASADSTADRPHTSVATISISPPTAGSVALEGKIEKAHCATCSV